MSLPSLRNFPFGLRCLSFEANVPRYTVVSRGFVSNFQRKYRGQVDEVFVRYRVTDGNIVSPLLFTDNRARGSFRQDCITIQKKFDRRYYNNLFSLPLIISILLDQLTGCSGKHCGFRACFSYPTSHVYIIIMYNIYLWDSWARATWRTKRKSVGDLMILCKLPVELLRSFARNQIWMEKIFGDCFAGISERILSKIIINNSCVNNFYFVNLFFRFNFLNRK